MKTELIEYHRARIFKESDLARQTDLSPLIVHHKDKALFHERAVAWLEGLDLPHTSAHENLDQGHDATHP